MAIKASNAITIIDVADVGRLSIYLSSNLPISTIYDPNTNTYSPNWVSTNLKITPVIYLNDTALSTTATGLTITWKRKEGSSSEASLTTGETISNGILTVSQNKLSAVSSGLLSYICYVTYKDPDSGVTVNAQSLMTYSLVSNATELHYASIDGANVFLYDSTGTLASDAQITLTANVTNVAISSWQYKKSDGTWVDYPTTSDNATVTGSTLIVKPAHAVFFNDVATIKLVTDDADVYDIISIVKLRDGSHSVAGALTNDAHTLYANSAGTISDYAGAESTLAIYQNGSDITSTYTIAITSSDGITGAQSTDKKTYTVTGMTVDSGKVTFAATRTGYPTVTKEFSLTRVKAGATGTTARTYFLDTDTLVLNKNTDNEFTPSTVTFSSFYRNGTAATRTEYAGRFIIQESTDGSTFTTKYTSSANESTKTYTPSSASIVSVKCTLYAAGGTTSALDTQTVMVTSDGADGAVGEAAINVVIGNESHVIPCDSTGYVLEDLKVTIPYSGYKGVSKVPCSISVDESTLPSGIKVGLVSSNADDWESGKYDINDGSKVTDETRIRLKELVPVESATEYIMYTGGSFDFILRFYDSSKNFTKSYGIVKDGKTFATDSDTSYVSITVYDSTNTSIAVTVDQIENGVIVPSMYKVSGMTTVTTTQDGAFTFMFLKGSSLGSSEAKTGTIDLIATCEGETFIKKFSWTKSNAAKDGTNAVIFEAITPTGNVIINSSNNVILETILRSGTTTVTSGIAYVWKKYASGVWETIDNETGSTLTVTPSMVDSVASFSCTATYNSKSYTAYATIIDKQDNYSVDAIATCGTQLKNGVGSGVIYYRLYQNGSEVDTLKSTDFLSTAPSSPTAGDFYYHVDKTNKTVTLKKYSGSAWTDATGDDLPTETYNTYRLDKDSLPMDDGEIWQTGKVIYIDGDMIDGKCTFVVEVE